MKRIDVVVICLLALLGVGSAHGGEVGEQTAVPDLQTIEELDLVTAQQIALAGNPTMHAAMARVEQARARVRQAAAAWWPSIDLTASTGFRRMSDSEWEGAQALARLSGQSADRTNEDTSAGLQASLVLFNGFYRKFNEQQARLGEESAGAARVDAQRLLAVAVAEAFLNAQLAQTNVDISQADSDFYNQQLRDAENRYEVGAGPWGDVLNIKVQLNSAKTNLLLAGREYEAAGYGLAALLGLPDAVLPSHVRMKPLDRDLAVSSDPIKTDQLIEEALGLRPDIERLILNVQEAESAVGKAESHYYPTIQLTGAANGARQGDVSLTGGDFGNSIILYLSWNIFAGGANKAGVFEAEQARRELNYTLLNLRNQVASEVRQSVAYLEAAREQVLLQRESVKLVEENRDLAKNEYEAGEASLVRLNEAQRDLTATYGRLAQALVAFCRAQQRLMAATGRNMVRLAGTATAR